MTDELVGPEHGQNSSTKTVWYDSPLVNVVGFALGVLLALIVGWRNGDILWSLWISSLFFGYASILIGIFSPIIRTARANGLSPLVTALLCISGLFPVAFFTVHFGMFHLIHGVFLNGFFPVDSVDSAGSAVGSVSPNDDGDSPKKSGFFGYLWPAISTYWPWLFIAAIAERKNVLRALHDDKFSPGRPYANVVRMHLLIIGLGFAVMAGVASRDGFVLFVVINLLYFFPWSQVFKGKNAGATE